MNRYFYADRIMNFVGSAENGSFGAWAAENSFDLVDLQRNAWPFAIQLWQEILADVTEGRILFEYAIPRLGKRIEDMVPCIPKGKPGDITRVPEFYDRTYQYLKQLGIPFIEENQ